MMGLEPQVPFILGTKVPKVGPGLGCEKFPKWELGRWSTPKVQGKAGPGPSSREARNPCQALVRVVQEVQYFDRELL